MDPVFSQAVMSLYRHAVGIVRAIRRLMNMKPLECPNCHTKLDDVF
jgi:hypothetical protein